MFDSYHAGSQTVKINAVTGAILKNHPKSWFERFSLKSVRAESVLREGGHRADRWTENNPVDIIVLQMVICGDMEVIAECVHREDFNAALSGGGGEDAWPFV